MRLPNRGLKSIKLNSAKAGADWRFTTADARIKSKSVTSSFSESRHLCSPRHRRNLSHPAHPQAELRTELRRALLSFAADLG